MNKQKTFSELMDNNFPKRAMRVTVGSIQFYFGENCRGKEEVKPEIIKWFDTHKYSHCWWSIEEIELVYPRNRKFEDYYFSL